MCAILLGGFLVVSILICNRTIYLVCKSLDQAFYSNSKPQQIAIDIDIFSYQQSKWMLFQGNGLLRYLGQQTVKSPNLQIENILIIWFSNMAQIGQINGIKA